MTAFRYRAATASGDLKIGVLEASSPADALERLRRNGLAPIEAVQTRSAPERGGARPGAAGRQAMINAVADLGVLLGAGMPLDRSLAICVDNARTPQLKGVLEKALARVKEGAALSAAMLEAGPAFPPMASAMAEAGEANGRLDEALQRLAATLDRGEALRRTVVSALIYPALLICVATGVIGVMLLFVIPQFENLFSDATVKLPLATRVVMGASQALRSYGWVAMLALGGAGFALRQALRAPGARQGLDEAVLKVPGVSGLVTKAETARFSRVLASLVDGGVPLPTALGIARRSLTNTHMADAISRVAAGLKQGGGLSAPLAATGLFPPMAVSFLRTGEETAQLGPMLDRLADVLERDLRTALQRLVDLITPTVTLLMAALVGGIIASIISAILGFNDLALPS
jgi:general secretion pathway protein F